MAGFNQDSPFFDFFETEPQGQRANYFGQLASQPRQSPNQRKFFESQFEEVQNRYLGQLGKMVQGGQSPTTSLSDYLKDYFAPGGGANEDFSNATRGQRVASNTRYAPPVQFMR